MYAWGWNSLENSAETVQLCPRMRSQKNTSFTFLHKTLQNTSWMPQGQRILICQGDIGCLGRRRESTRMSPGHEEQGRKSSTAKLHEGSYKVYRGSRKFAGQRKEGQWVKKSIRGRSEAWRVERKRRKQGQEVTWIEAEESLSSGLVTSKQWRVFIVCIRRVSLTATLSFLPFSSPACCPLASPCPLQVSCSSSPQVTSLHFREVER